MQINPPVFLNEWMNDLLMKIKSDDKSTSQICAFMYGMMKAPWNNVKSVSLSWDEDDYNYVMKPVIRIEFK